VDDELPNEAWAGAEAAIGGLLAIPLNVLVVVAENESRDDVVLRAVLEPAAMWSTMLAAHGIWAAGNDDAEPTEVLGASAMLGVNIPLTVAALSQAVPGRLSAPATAVVQLATTAPAVALGSYGAATSPGDSAGWIGLTAWSGALLLHGTASLIWGSDVEPPGSVQRRAGLEQVLEHAAVSPFVPISTGAPGLGLAVRGRL
jgi:hypothetical protein